ncbi:hypothetical protein ABZ851_36840 [Streptomyces sp. NPDC047049]|uniref:hypothetical protein n=1 Tax=Streptomyces sp. NPDC047049 TaxID=3156688 RepID=UPI0033C0C0F7
MTTPPKTRAEILAERLAARNEAEREAADSEAGTGAGQAEEPAKPQAEVPPQPAPEKRVKFQAYVLDSVQSEARAIVYWTNNRPGGYASLTELAEAALIREIDRMREQFTGGEPFPPMPEGRSLPTRPPAA